MDKMLMLLQIVPALIDVIKKIEETYSESGKGSEKLSMTVELLQLGQGITSELKPLVTSAISIIVKYFNMWKVFKTSDVK